MRLGRDAFRPFSLARALPRADARARVTHAPPPPSRHAGFDGDVVDGTTSRHDLADASEDALCGARDPEAFAGEDAARETDDAATAAAVAAACAAAGLADVTIKRVFTDERARRANAAPALALIDARRGANKPIKNATGAGDARLDALVNDSCVLYADEAQRTYGEEVETFMRNLGL